MENEDDYQLAEDAKPYNIRHRCFLFAKDVIHAVGLMRYPLVLSSLFDQLVRSATSIGANAVEGSSGSSKKDFIKFYVIALKSANETKYWLCLIRDTVECDKDLLTKLLREAEELSKILATIIKSAKSETGI